jgi:hypothetical protein
MGILATACDNLSISDCVVYSPESDGIKYITQAITNNKNITIRGNAVVDAGGIGIHIAAASDLSAVLVQGNRVSDSVSTGIKMLAQGSAADNAIIVGFDVSGNTLYYAAGSDIDSIAMDANTSTGTGTIGKGAIHGNTVAMPSGAANQGLVFAGDGIYADMVVHGNTFYGGTNVLEEGATAAFGDVYVAGNFFFDYTTADIVAGSLTYSASVVDGTGTDTLPNFKDA